MAQRGKYVKMQVDYQAGTTPDEQEYHQYLFYHPLKQDSHASMKTLMRRLPHCHEFFCKNNYLYTSFSTV